MEDGKKSRGEKALVAGILILGVLILAAAAYLWLFIMNKPVMVLTAPSVTVEAGDTFDEWTMVKSLEHVRDEQVTIDRENLDTNTPGEYEVVYTLKGLTGEESLPVSVKVVDTVPPVLKVTEEVYEGQPGDVVNINQFVVDASDRTGVTCTFEDGSTEKALDEGSYELGIVARDGAGNESRASVSVQVIVPDQEAPVIGGALMGFGVGLTFLGKGTTGGTDTVAALINKVQPHISSAKILPVLDGAIILLSVWIFGVRNTLYAIVSVAISGYLSDHVLYGVRNANLAFIISDHNDEIADALLQDMNRGVTRLRGTGMYTDTERSVLMCAVSKRQTVIVKEIVSAIDPAAFLILTDAGEIRGEGFLDYSHEELG